MISMRKQRADSRSDDPSCPQTTWPISESFLIHHLTSQQPMITKVVWCCPWSQNQDSALSQQGSTFELRTVNPHIHGSCTFLFGSFVGRANGSFLCQVRWKWTLRLALKRKKNGGGVPGGPLTSQWFSGPFSSSSSSQVSNKDSFFFENAYQCSAWFKDKKRVRNE